MEEFTQKWAIVSLLEDISEGSEFYYTDFPLHVTLAGVFAIKLNGQQIIEELERLLAGITPVRVEADENAMFGPNKDIAVMKLMKTPELMSLYAIIHEWLSKAEAVYNAPRYQGEGYLPHVTSQKTGSLKPGETRVLHSVSLIDLFPNRDGYRRKVSKTIGLYGD